ncbi:MAG TPA: aminotransferase class III-fold pyridoxal phosphate-dependent enzyme [Saprospiraceae bacterium]|nr:aminotransferase class III-fold pyridoxal phosphate-dependent enzyme [Saprospiraceae bacterium]
MLHQLFLRHVAQTSPAPLGLEIERAEGCWLFDTAGKKYLDLIAGIGPSVLGHRHPRVQAAVEQQLNSYWHTLVYGEFVLSPQVKLARLLAENLPGLDSVYFVNSGAEAAEGAMKLAKRYTGRPNFVACRDAYHGSTQGAASLMAPTDFTLAFQPLLPGIQHIDFNCEAGLEKIDRHTAAVVVETIQGEAGLLPPRPEWLQMVRRRCDETGALLILDEIQAGMGRTGHLFAFEPYSIVPDILLLAKGFGGGMPLGAFIARREVMQTLTHDPVLGHITTFGGHPVCAAAGLATLEILLESDLLAQVPAKEALFRELLVHPAIREVRSAGLWLAVDLGDATKVQQVIRHCIANGVITDWFLFNDRSLRIAPPLIVMEEEIQWACSVILSGLDLL